MSTSTHYKLQKFKTKKDKLTYKVSILKINTYLKILNVSMSKYLLESITKIKPTTWIKWWQLKPIMMMSLIIMFT